MKWLANANIANICSKIIFPSVFATCQDIIKIQTLN
jgi:hypothetical protein